MYRPLHAIKPLLYSDVRWTESQEFQISFRSAPLNLSNEMKSIRERALDMLITGLRIMT